MQININEFLKDKENVYFGSKYNATYLSQFESSNMHVFYTNKQFFFLTDERYLNSAKKSINSGTVLDISLASTWEQIRELVHESESKVLFLDSEETLISTYNQMKNIFNLATIKLSSDFEKIRKIKTNQEIQNIKKAIEISDNIFKKLTNFIKVGRTEVEVEKFIMTLIINSEADKESFRPIVASGSNSSYPHWSSSEKKINENEFVIIDLGQYYKGMPSDITRTFFVGETIDEEKLKIYEIVLEANRRAINIIKPGVKISEVDNVAREYIKEMGYEEQFNHSTGHGLGLYYHEWPNVSKYSSGELEEGMIITIEPGIYLKDKFGVRIEDDILVTATGYEILNKFPKELIMLKGQKHE